MTWIKNRLRSAVQMILGSRKARRDLRLSRGQADDPVPGIQRLLASQTRPDDDDEQPIFILSAGWRSGSTLLQRLISSGESVLIWGEPYDRANLVKSLVRTAAPFSDTWPPADYLKPTVDLGALTSQWTANLYPPEAAVYAAHRAFLTELFAVPARELGARHWGFKEVRLGHVEALYLKALFPRARFLFIRRRLADAYRSYRDFSSSMAWYAEWPHVPVFTPFAFARHWSVMVREVERAARETGGMLIEYEDLAAGKVDLVKLSDYCGFQINDQALRRKVGASSNKGVARLSTFERLLLALGQATGGKRASQSPPA